MEEILSIFLLMLGVGTACYISFKLGFLAPVSVYLWFLVIDIGLFFVIYFNNLSRADFTFTAMPWPDFGEVFLQTTIVHTLLLLLGALSSLGIRKARATSKNNQIISDTLSKMKANFGIQNKNMQFILFFYILFVVFIEIYHFIELDKTVFLSNNTYLMLVNPSSAGFITPIGRLAHLLLPFLGLILVALANYFWFNRSWILSGMIFVLSIYPFLMVFAQNSRWAPLYPMGSVAIGLIFGKRKLEKLLTIITMGFISFALFLKVLVGRGTSYQGLLGTWEIFRLISSDEQAARFLRSIPFNIFQGTQNFANTLILAPEYPTAYKLLSFSPTISLIDNFARQVIHTAKITPVVPINAYGEAYHFGFAFFAALLFIFFVWLRYVTIAHLKGGIIGSAISLAAYWVIFYISQYPLRNSMRFIYISLLVTLIFAGKKRRT